jgi:hypothetical protein
MSLAKILPAWLHAIADYAVGALLIIVALTVSMSGAAEATGVIVGAVVLAVSMATKYPLGVVKVLPFRIHSLGDYAAAALLIGAPFALGFNTSDSGVTALYIGVAVAVLAVSAITNYQYGETPMPADLAVELAVPAPVLMTVPTTTSSRRPRPLRAAGH